MTITTVGYDLSPKTFLGSYLVLYTCKQFRLMCFSHVKDYSLIRFHAGKVILIHVFMQDFLLLSRIGFIQERLLAASALFLESSFLLFQFQ